MSTIVNTAFFAGPGRPDTDRTRAVLKWLAARLLRDEQRKRPPITLPGRPVVAVPAEARPPAPPLPPEARGWGPNLDCDSRENQNSVPEPGDLIGPYSHEQLLRMHDRFVHRMERAFASGWERRASAASYQSEKHVGGYGMPIALTDAQLAMLRQFATPIPRSLRDAFLRDVARRLAGVEVGDGTVHVACAAAQREVIDDARRRE
jgi:hypothetical protein